MPTVFSALMCHAPIVIPAVAGAEAAKCRRTTRAMREVAQRAIAAAPDRLVLISPHSPRRRTGFGAWRGPHRGDLAMFRAPDVAVDLPDAPDVATALELPEIGGEALDHGAMVPLSFLWDAGWRGATAILALPWDGAGADAVGSAIAQLPGRTAVIASGDMSHRLIPGAPAGFHPDAAAFDRAFVDALARDDWTSALHPPHRDVAAEDVVDSAAVAMAAAGAPRHAEVIAYEGPWGVGYTEAIFADPSPPLYAVARRAIRAHLAGQGFDAPAGGAPAAPVFVTLRTADGDLRGCIGTLAATTDRLYAEVAHVAPEAATEDPRFPPVRADELDDLGIEVSILDPAEPVADRATLDPKRFGVIATWRDRRGLLLPDIDGVDSVDLQIDIVRRKAGIPRDADLHLERFTVTKEEMP